MTAFIIAFSAQHVSNGEVTEQKFVNKWLWILKEKSHFECCIIAFSWHNMFQMLTSKNKNLFINGCKIQKKKSILYWRINFGVVDVTCALTVCIRYPCILRWWTVVNYSVCGRKSFVWVYHTYKKRIFQRCLNHMVLVSQNCQIIKNE